MIVLGIETCSPHGGVALLSEGRLLGSQLIASSRAHSRLIMPAIETILRENKMNPGDIDAVAVSAGPGSFVGVRVGLTLGKALCESGAPRLVLVDTLRALAHHAWCGERTPYVVATLDARQGEVYASAFATADGEVAPEPLFGPEALSPEALRDRWPGEALFVGRGVEACLASWGDAAPAHVRPLPHRDNTHPESVAFLGAREAGSGNFADPLTAEPLYLRGASISQPKPRKTT